MKEYEDPERYLYCFPTLAAGSVPDIGESKRVGGKTSIQVGLVSWVRRGSGQ